MSRPWRTDPALRRDLAGLLLALLVLALGGLVVFAIGYAAATGCAHGCGRLYCGSGPARHRQPGS